MRYVVAVSGGIDSVVLLHQLVAAGEHELIVAHFDHGIRPDSASDARFVAALAASYGLPFIGHREELGADASEDLARQHRYRFLRQSARQYVGAIVTAHHYDDVVESVAINLTRGTGWRGLAVLDSADIVRPLLDQPKQMIRQYALDNLLEWVEDSTNGDIVYLRNRLRRLINTHLSVDQRETVWHVWQRQIHLKQAITAEIEQLLSGDSEYSRYVLTMSDRLTAGELLRQVIMRNGQPTPTRPQLSSALLAIKTARSGAVHHVGDGVQLRFTKRTFIVETTR